MADARGCVVVVSAEHCRRPSTLESALARIHLDTKSQELSFEKNQLFLSETGFGPLLGASRRLAFSEFDFEHFEILNFVWALKRVDALILE